ncbi:MAG: hypothetical protein LBL55_10165 [Propionibacteriaceae bacterium]|jgi:cell fate regulator YaaT (PSP1 superfamily)|nr:hypothetical protein [Propionibacteriaceae bacterium]
MTGTTERPAAQTVAELVARHGLPLRVLAVEEEDDPNFGPVLRVVYTAPQRVDFRALVLDLAKAFRRRIDMRQVGERERTRRLGGVGVCGRTLCCATFLTQLEPVPVALTRQPGLWSDPERLTGRCGRLMCCLRFEPDDPPGPDGPDGPTRARLP